MAKWLCWISMGIAFLVFVLFVLDMIPGIEPLGGLGVSLVPDIIGIIVCLLLMYLSWNAYRDTR